MTKTKRLCFTIALFGAMAMLFSNCKKDDDKGKDDIVKDIDGNEYKTVKIGEQVWMAENLKTTRYRNGNPIEYPSTDNDAWENNSTGAYAWYDNDINWKDSYGALYNWQAVNNANGLCPTDWHVPSDDEWAQLVDFVVTQGFPNNHIDDPNGFGNALKSCRQEYSPLGSDCTTTEHPRWHYHNTHHGFDEFGFSVLPGGQRGINGEFGWVGYQGTFWSTTVTYPTHAWNRGMANAIGLAYRGSANKEYGYSVRCLKDN